MNNLIINGIDHSVFDLEWAKRGGRLLCQHTSGDKTLGVLSLVGECVETGTLIFGVIYDGFDGWTVRMATPDECKAAGIEYIDPPIRWLQIDSAPEDGRIIEVADFRVVVANEGPLSKHWKFWRDIPHPLNKNSMTQPPKGD